MRTLVVVAALNNRQDFQREQVDDARNAALRVGIDVEVVFAQDNAVTQISQLFEAIQRPKEKRPTALLIESATNEGHEQVARIAVKEGVGWVLMSGRAAYLERLGKEFPSVLVSCAATDEDEIGAAMVKQYRALLPNGGDLFYIEGLAGSAGAVIRRRHAEQELKGSNIRIRKILTADWQEDRAERVLSFWLQTATREDFKPALIAVQNDAMAIGARKAIMQHRPAWAGIPMTGCDGLPGGGQRLVDSGQLAATVVKPPTGGRGMELIASFVRKEPTPPCVIISPRSYPPLERLAQTPRPGK